MKAGVSLCLGVSMLAAPALAWQAAPVGTLTAVPVQSSSSSSVSRAPAAPCSAVAIRQAAAQKVAPQLTGCAYDAVAPYVQQFYRITPVVTETAGRRAKGTILTQQPTAGAALATGGTLRLSVSTGVPAPAASRSSSSAVNPNTTEPVPGAAALVPQASSSSSSSSVAPVVRPQPAPAEVVETPVKPVIEAPTPEPAVVAALPEIPVPVEAPKKGGGGVFPVLIVLLLGAVGAAVYTLRHKIWPSAAPDIRCDLEFGEGRLIVDGPLIEGPAIEVRVATEFGPLTAEDISIEDRT